jgi:serine/threonine protein kinase
MEAKRAQLAGCKFLAPLERVVSRAEDQYCSTFYKVYALFEFGQRTLDQEVSERRVHGRKFAENELWSILASCILGLAHLQRNGIRHEALRSAAVLVSKEGVIRLYDPIATGAVANFEALSTRRGTGHLYLSPELCESLQQEGSGSGVNPFKADIFTLGVVML